MPTSAPSLAANRAGASAFDVFLGSFGRGALAEAERLGAQVLAASPDRGVDVWTRLGLLRRRSGNAVGAAEAFLAASRAATPRHPLPDWFHSELSGAYMDQRAWPQALDAAEAGSGVKPALGLTAARALLHMGQPDAARAVLRRAVRALAHDPARAPSVASVCGMLLAADGGCAAQAVAAEAAAAYAGSAEFDELRAILAVLRQDWAAAARRYAELVNPAKPPPLAALQRLGAALRQAPARRSAFAPVFEAAMLAAPDSEAALFQWRDALPDASDEAFTAGLLDVQGRSATLVPSVVAQLARRLPPDDIRRRFAGQIDAWQCSEAVLACEASLQALCRFEDPGPQAVERVLAVPDLRVRLFFLLREPRLRAVRVREPSAAEDAELRAAGVDVAAVQAFLGGLVGPLPPEWDAYLRRAAFASPDAERTVRQDEGFTAFQDRIVREREFRMVDPLDGGPADLFDSVKIHDRQVFSFRGTELVTFHTAGNMNFAVALHLPRRNLLLLPDTAGAPSKQGFYAADRHMAEVQSIWLRRAARSHAALLRAAGAARAARGTPRRVVALHGRAENPAHHVWNYLPPFERLAMAGLIGNIAAVVPPPTLYFGPLPGLFPELAAIESRPVGEAAVIDPCPFSPHDIALQLGGSFIPRPLVQRVRRWAERQAPQGGRAERERLSRRHPVIWVGLRVGDKVWVNQAAGLAGMIDLIVPLYPDALFVLDGFSLPDDARAVPEKWHAAVRALEAEAEAVRSRTAHPAAVHSLVGNRLSESVLWAQAAHAYFAPLGSSQHKVGWFSGAPGLVYTSKLLAGTPPARRQGAWEAEGSPVPRFLVGEVAEPGRRRGDYDFRNNLENVDFPAHVAARRLLGSLGAAEE